MLVACVNSPFPLIFFLVFSVLPKQQTFYYPRLKEFAEDNFKCDENGRKLSKRVENTVEKGDIAC